MDKKIQLKEFAEIELKHIQVELQHKRYQHFRHFVDQYFCYAHGYINKNGTASWERIVWKEYVSKKAQTVSDRKQVVKEHVIPLKRITLELKKLREENRIKLVDIRECLESFVFFATITKEEDSLLRKAGLTSRMPSGYDQPGHPLFKDPFARYKSVGIEYIGPIRL